MQGLILAAGRGSRMASRTGHGPKCLVEVGGRPLLDRQVAALRAGGAVRIGVVGGWRAEALHGRGVEVLHNPDWATTTMVGTLCRAVQWLARDTTLVSYGDIVFTAETVRRLAACDADLALAYDRDWLALWERRFDDPLDDAERFALDSRGCVAAIGGPVGDRREIAGQYVGLVRWTPGAWRRFGGVLCGYQQSDEGRRVDMTAALGRLIAEHGARIAAVPVDGPWFEFDSTGDLAVGEPVVCEVDRRMAAAR
jgi:choline kinase